MNQVSSADFLMNFTSDLRARKALPKNIEITQIGPVFLASVFNELRSEIITESIFSGMDVDSDLAVLKGFVEMIERRAFADGKARGLGSCNTERSDGFAAMTKKNVSNSEDLARKNAYHEAVERFVWATWWDRIEFRHDLHQISKTSSSAATFLLKELSNILPISSTYRLTPKIANFENAVVTVFFTFLEPFGVISGGASGVKSDMESVDLRAASELLRHALAIRKMKTHSLAPTTFYEKRLAYFGLTKKGSDDAMTRMLREGTISIELPKLSIDSPIPHSLDDIVSVHRCYFEGQPPFVGGRLERLCL